MGAIQPLIGETAVFIDRIKSLLTHQKVVALSQNPLYPY